MEVTRIEPVTLIDDDAARARAEREDKLRADAKKLHDEQAERILKICGEDAAIEYCMNMVRRMYDLKTFDRSLEAMFRFAYLKGEGDAIERFGSKR